MTDHETTARIELPRPKYWIGDRVWHAHATSTVKHHPCPDCLDTGDWKVVTGTGAEMTVQCPRCAKGLGRPAAIPDLNYRVYEPAVRQLTIGSVRTDTNEKPDQVEYMCIETGVGGGYVYRESDLFGSHEEALAAAQARAAELTQQLEKPETLEKQRFAYLTFKDAILEGVHSAVFNAFWRYRNLVEELEGLVGDKTMLPSQFKREVEAIFKHEGGTHQDPTPLKALLVAAEKHRDDPDVAKALDAITPAGLRSAGPAPGTVTYTEDRL